MTMKRKSYSNQFKIYAVKLVTEQGYKASLSVTRDMSGLQHTICPVCYSHRGR